jgi:molybdopterin-guanine dinucleotide biosynthesis protein A
MPALAPALLLLLADACADHDAAFPRLGDRLEPLPAACRTSILPAIERLLAGTDDPPLQGIASAVRTRYVEESAIRLADPALQSFLNLNTPDDFARVAQLLT